MKTFLKILFLILIALGCLDALIGCAPKHRDEEFCIEVFDSSSGVSLVELCHEKQHTPLEYVGELKDFFQEYGLDNEVSLKKGEDGKTNYIFKYHLTLKECGWLIDYLKTEKGFYEY